MTRTYSLVNQKGGVGKTTTAINLGAWLAELGGRILLVDTDPQANATACLGVDHRALNEGTYDVLIGRLPVQQAILHNARLRLSLLPATAALAGAQIELVDLDGREALLRQALRPILSHYDYVFIDCPPSLGILTLNALLATSDGVIIPVQCEYLALEGLTQLRSTLQRVQRALFPELSIRGMLMTMYDSRTNLSHDVMREVRQHFPSLVFESVIPRNIRLAEAPSHGLPISAYDPNSSGGAAYRALAEELLRGDGLALPSPPAAAKEPG
jgi:chromosome partitioning protein